jgi:uncharacterized membrane protein YphA (DoxX/SURF4 family)
MTATILTIVSAVSFLYYGFSCLFTETMVLEFDRFGLSTTQRKLTGTFQLLGSIGLLVGLLTAPVGLVASGGLTLLMFLGVLTRMRIRDSFVQILPAALFMLLNMYLYLSFAGKV